MMSRLSFLANIEGVVTAFSLGVQQLEQPVNTSSFSYLMAAYSNTNRRGRSSYDISKDVLEYLFERQKRSTEGCSKLKGPETRQVQERLVSTLEHMQVPKWDRTRCPEE